MFSVALIGPDGAGKTTLTARLQQSSTIPVKCLYMGINIEASNHALPTSRFVEYFKRRQNAVSGAHRCGNDSPPQGVNVKRGLGGWLWATGRLINRVLEEWYRQLLSWSYQIRGYAVVYDRHFLYDFTLDGIDGEKQSADKRIHRRLLENCYPQPHLTIYLDAPAEVLFARKGEKTLEELERRRQAFLQLGYRTKNFVRIDATRPFDAVYAEVSGLIEHGYRNKHANAGHGLRLQLQRLGRLLNLPRR
jgi:thymidylate kinase